MLTLYGQVSIAKAHPLSQQGLNGISMSPYLQSLVLRGCADLVPNAACELLNQLAGFELVSGSQAYRLIHEHCGDGEVEGILDTPLERPGPAVAGSEGEGGGGGVIYAMCDGGMIPYDEGYREVKVGRVFLGSDISTKPSEYEDVRARSCIERSDYISFEGHYGAFVAHFKRLIDRYIQGYPGYRLVFVTDGATWMQDWVEREYPEATHVLDFFHPYERLCDFGVLKWASPKERQAKLKEFKDRLLGGEVDAVIEEIQKSENSTDKKVAEAASGLLVYLKGKRHRMRYDEYMEAGHYIGSGAIESAIRTALQQRCKLSGQRWSDGLQPVLNLRAVKLSNKFGKLMEYVDKKFRNAA